MNEFKTGDVVNLKGNGPRMTIESISSMGIDCVWFDGAELNHGHFNGDMLELSPSFYSTPV